MRKLFLVAILALLSQVGFAQAVQDNAVIPVSVTINSILRLNVTSGGNIQFVFNTMAQYNSGIAGSALTTTRFNVASSRPYHVTLGAEDGSLVGVEGGNSMNLGVVIFNIPAADRSTSGAGTLSSPDGDDTDTPLVDQTGVATILQNDEATGPTPDECAILWSAGTGVERATGYPADVYVTNVYLTLLPN